MHRNRSDIWLAAARKDFQDIAITPQVVSEGIHLQMCFIKMEIFRMLFDVLEPFIRGQLRPGRADLMRSLRKVLLSVRNRAESINEHYIRGRQQPSDVLKLFKTTDSSCAQTINNELDEDFKALIDIDYQKSAHKQ